MLYAISVPLGQRTWSKALLVHLLDALQLRACLLTWNIGQTLIVLWFRRPDVWSFKARPAPE